MKNLEYEVVLTQDFRGDLLEIFTYLCGFSQSIADKYMKLIDIEIARLQTPPFGATFVRDEELRSKGYQWIYIKNYYIFFIVKEEEKKVLLERILYSRRAFDLIL